MEMLPYSVCCDCLLFLAYGELPEGTADAQSILDGEAAAIREGGLFSLGYYSRVWCVTGEDTNGLSVDETEHAQTARQAKEAVLCSPYYDGLRIEDLHAIEITEQFETVEFSLDECELCRSSLGGSRHAVTLIITE